MVLVGADADGIVVVVMVVWLYGCYHSHRCAPPRCNFMRIQNEDMKVNNVLNADFWHLNPFKSNQSRFFKLN